MESIRDREVIDILSHINYPRAVTFEEVGVAYHGYTGALLAAFNTELGSRVGRLIQRALPTINFWPHAYDYIKLNHYWASLPKYICCGQSNVKAWEKVIEAYYLKYYNFNKVWKGTRFRLYPGHTLFYQRSAPIGLSIPNNDDIDVDDDSENKYE